MAKQNPSGVVRFENDAVVYSYEKEELWRMPAREIRVIGEYTNDHGPTLDDYFFVFVTKEVDQWYEASFYADGRDSLLAALSLRLGNELRPGLCNSTDLKSRILWPKQLEGQDLFVFVPEARAKNVLGRLRQSIVPKVFFELSDPVRKLVGSQTD